MRLEGAQRVDALVEAVVRSDFLVEEKAGDGGAAGGGAFREDGDGGVIAERAG